MIATLPEIDSIYVRKGAFHKVVMRGIATSEEKRDLKFKILTSDYPVEALSISLEENFLEANFEILSKLHLARLNRHLRQDSSIKVLLNLVLSIGVIILNIIPTGVIEGFGFIYSKFQIITFWVTFGVILYLSFIYLLSSNMEKSLKQRRDFITEILEYTSLRNSHASTRASHNPKN